MEIEIVEVDGGKKKHKGCKHIPEFTICFPFREEVTKNQPGLTNYCKDNKADKEINLISHGSHSNGW